LGQGVRTDESGESRRSKCPDRRNGRLVCGREATSPGSDLLVSVRTPPRMLQFIGQTQGVVRNHTRPTLWPRGLHGTTVRAYAGALPAVPGAPTENRKCFGLHISRSSSRELRSRIGSVYLGFQPVRRPNCHRPTGVRQNAFRPKSSHPGVPTNNPTNPSAVVPNHIPCLNPVGWRFRDHCATGVRLTLGTSSCALALSLTASLARLPSDARRPQRWRNLAPIA